MDCDANDGNCEHRRIHTHILKCAVVIRTLGISKLYFEHTYTFKRPGKESENVNDNLLTFKEECMVMSHYYQAEEGFTR